MKFIGLLHIGPEFKHFCLSESLKHKNKAHEGWEPIGHYFWSGNHADVKRYSKKSITHSCFVYNVSLELKKPLVIDGIFDIDVRKYIQNKYIKSAWVTFFSLGLGFGLGTLRNRITENLKQEGYDGIVSNDQVVCFNDNIKINSKSKYTLINNKLIEDRA